MTARYLAVKALIRQEQNGYADLVLDAELKKCAPPLPARDAAFAAAVFYTAVERLHLLDWQLAKASTRPLARLDAPVRAILRAGLAQGRYMGVPVPAAVSESVKLARAFGKTSAAGMVNAVLRRALAAPAPQAQDFADPLERLTVFYSLSAPVAALLSEQYGPEAEALAAAFGQKRPTAVRVNTLRTDAAALTAQLTAEGHTVRGPGPVPGSLLVELAGSPAGSRAFRQGLFHVQGLASQYAALCLDVKPGQRVLDLCAAPGGKTLLLAQQMQDTGTLIANDVSAPRVQKLRQALERAGITCAEAVCHDAAAWAPEPAPFDAILCDVPCTGLGVIGKKPDIRYKPLQDLDALHLLQASILQNAAKALAQNGHLVYSTCTVDHREDQAQVQRFLHKNPDFRLIPPPLAFPGTRDTGFGTLFLPHETGTDGFFVAVLEKHSLR